MLNANPEHTKRLLGQIGMLHSFQITYKQYAL